jgi:hypothetical protein
MDDSFDFEKDEIKIFPRSTGSSSLNESSLANLVEHPDLQVI